MLTESKQKGLIPPTSHTEKVNFLEQMGKVLREGGIERVQFLACRVGRDSAFAQMIADRLGVKAGFFKDKFGHGESNGRITAGQYYQTRSGEDRLVPGTGSTTEISKPDVVADPKKTETAEQKK